MNPWIFVFFAGCLEVVWAVTLKETAGFTKLVPSAITIGAMAGSFYLLSQALKNLPIGTAYAAWTGIGAIGTAILGIYLYNEPASLARVLCILLIAAGIVGLRVFG